MNTDLMFSSKTEEWSTPQDFFAKLNDEFHFDLDVCANWENAKCYHFYSKDFDGLINDWAPSVCWMNPPYGRNVTGKWMKKAYEESLKGATVVCLVPARTDTKWFHEYVLGKAEIRFVKGRLKFGGSENSAPFPSMIVIYSNQ